MMMMSGPASRCQGDVLATVSFEGLRLPLSILLWHPSPTMMVDLTGSEKTALGTFLERAIAEDRYPPPLRGRTLDALVAELERSPALAAALSHGGFDERQRRKSKR
jgi:hypothetical protein